MSYSIIGSGQQKKRQALGSFDLLARQERQSNSIEERLDAQDEAQTNSAIGSVAGMGAKAYFTPRSGDPAPIRDIGTQADGTISQTAIQDAGQTAVQEVATDTAGNTINQTAINEGIQQGAAEVGAQIGTEVVGDAAATAVGEAAVGEAAVAAGTEAAVAAGAEVAVGGAAAATETAAAASAFGPIGWVIGAGLLAHTLFG